MAKRATKFTEHASCKNDTLATLNFYVKGVDKSSFVMAQKNWKIVVRVMNDLLKMYVQNIQHKYAQWLSNNNLKRNCSFDVKYNASQVNKW